MSSSNDRAVLNMILNPLMPTETTAGDAPIPEDKEIAHEGFKESRKIELEGVAKAEQGDVEEALRLFTAAIEICPVNPSIYNNRAQALRLLGKIDDSLTDLDKAIELSGGSGKSACQSFVQRAMVRRLQGKSDEAKADFQRAADLGSSFAKMQLVAINPYAAMCNKMLSEVMGKLQRGEETDKPSPSRAG
uniref:TPR_REGION domain-containing protein n=1 Tax=Steinernema glaseri TaxID=37863 RepID=A0A1I7Z8R4_9BILA